MIRRAPVGPKYGNQPQQCRQGNIHQSRLEARRCDELFLMQAGGLVSDLEAHPQPVYRLEVNGHHICKYLADFKYVDETGQMVVEDVKGGPATRTREYILKKKLMLAIHDIEIVEVTRARGVR